MVHRCREAYPTALASLPPDVTVALQVFVMPDGRIAQGRIERSSGDAEVDQTVFKCVQTYANLEPTIVDGNPVGSWQAVTAQWGRQ
jgi:TonB family protein